MSMFFIGKTNKNNTSRTSFGRASDTQLCYNTCVQNAFRLLRNGFDKIDRTSILWELKRVRTL